MAFIAGGHVLVAGGPAATMATRGMLWLPRLRGPHPGAPMRRRPPMPAALPTCCARRAVGCVSLLIGVLNWLFAVDPRYKLEEPQYRCVLLGHCAASCLPLCCVGPAPWIGCCWPAPGLSHCHSTLVPALYPCTPLARHRAGRSRMCWLWPHPRACWLILGRCGKQAHTSADSS